MASNGCALKTMPRIQNWSRRSRTSRSRLRTWRKRFKARMSSFNRTAQALGLWLPLLKTMAPRLSFFRLIEALQERTCDSRATARTRSSTWPRRHSGLLAFPALRAPEQVSFRVRVRHLTLVQIALEELHYDNGVRVERPALPFGKG